MNKVLQDIKDIQKTSDNKRQKIFKLNMLNFEESPEAGKANERISQKLKIHNKKKDNF